MEPYNFLKEEVHNIDSIIALVASNEVNHFGESIYHYYDSIFSLKGSWKGHNDVHANVILRPWRDRKRSVETLCNTPSPSGQKHYVFLTSYLNSAAKRTEFSLKTDHFQAKSLTISPCNQQKHKTFKRSSMAILYGIHAHKVGICHITTKCY